MDTIQPAHLEHFITVLHQIPFNRTLGLKLTAIEKDHIIIEFPMSEHLVGNFMQGILHGGVISAVLDMAGGTMAMAAALYKHPEKNINELEGVLGKSSTINMQVDYIRPGKGQKFIAKAWLMHRGNRITFTRMELRNESSTLIAAGSATYMVR